MASAARPRRPLSRLAAVAAASFLLLSGCTLGDGGSGSEGSGGAESDGGGSAADAPASDDGASELEQLGTSAAADLPSDPAEDPAYAEYYEQEISWGPCEDVAEPRMECGTLTVPLVWNDPSAGDIELGVGRLAATGERTGALVTNPGGPGVSAVNFLENMPYVLSEQVSAAYDQVGMDPRGVQRSAGIQCLEDEETDEYLSATAEEDSEEEQLGEEWAAWVAQSCEAGSGDVLPYLDTLSSARDMDVLRAALGEEQLDYLGYSYGTFLGASFAELYPERVGHVVLDGAVDPTLTREQYAAGQAEGFEHAVEAFLADCLGQGEQCPFEGGEQEAKQQLLDLLDGIDAEPLRTADPQRPLTGALARGAVLTLLYDDGQWEMGREALAGAMEGDGTALLRISDRSNERSLDGSYRTNATFAITAVNCLDRPGLADDAAVEHEADRLAEEFPTFGPMLGGDSCEQWPEPPLREPAPITAEGSEPIVVIGTTGDPATPYPWAQGLAEQLDQGVLLTFEGNGHTAYGRSGGCIEEQVDAYLLEDTVPTDGLSC